MARRQVDVRREEILRATVEQVTRLGFAGTRVADIATALGISTGLVSQRPVRPVEMLFEL